MYKDFFDPFSRKLHPDDFLSLALPTLPSCKAFTAGLVAPSSVASHPLLPEALLSVLRVTLTSIEWALHLSTFFPILGLVRLGVKLRLSGSSWTPFGSIYPLMLSPTSLREVLFACPPSSLWNPLSFTRELTLFSPCSQFDPLLSRQGAAIDHDLVIRTDGFVCFLLTKATLRSCPAFGALWSYAMPPSLGRSRAATSISTLSDLIALSKI